MIIRQTATICALAVFNSHLSLGQTKATPPASNPPADFSKAVDKGMSMPTPIDKFLALTLLIKTKDINWKGLFNANQLSVDVDTITDKEVQIPLLIGARMADGVMAVQAKDAALLKKVASDIEKLAEKIDLSKEDLSRSKRITQLAEANKWLLVIAELGFLQQDIMQKLEERNNDPRSTLVILAGWYQGARYTSSIILDNYSDDTSNILREPLLVKHLQTKSATLPDSVKNHKMVAGMIEGLPTLHDYVNIGIDKPISKANVEKIQKIVDPACKKIIDK